MKKNLMLVIHTEKTPSADYATGCGGKQARQATDALVQLILPRKTSNYFTISMSNCSLSFPAFHAHAPYYTVICGLSGSTFIFQRRLIRSIFFREKN